MPTTHEVLNQPPPLLDYNLYTADPMLSDGVEREGAGAVHEELDVYGGRIGTAEMIALGDTANRFPPELHTHDRFGHRSDQVEFHPAWHRFLDLAVTSGVHSLPWEDDAAPGAFVARSALAYMATQTEAGHMCPISMTTSVVPALRTTPVVAGEWVPRIVTRSYDPAFAPAPHKSGVLFGMGMTEKQGGSDVRANTTTGVPVNGGGPGGDYRITGHKWFTSAPMCDAFLVLAQAPAGLSCFLVPRWTPDEVVNRLRVQRLKHKLGNRSNASSEIEFDGAHGVLVGEEGRGVRTILEMVNGTRLDCVTASAGLMRQAVSQAAWHVAHRRAFGGALLDKPLMANVMADLEIETESATLMMLQLARAFDEAPHDPHAAAFRRIATPIAKYWVSKRCTGVVREAMECLGGNGYVEESMMPRLFRESPLNAIWEGSGNVIALDTVRAIGREPESLEVFIDEIATAHGADIRLDAAIEQLRPTLAAAGDPEGGARRIVETLATLWAASLMVRYAEPAAADAFVTSRIAGAHGTMFGTLPPTPSLAAIARSAVPEV